MSKQYFDMSAIGKVFTLYLIVAFNSSMGQDLPATTTINKYTIAQKRLLAINTCEFINFFSQTILDQDSLMEISCRITGMPFLLPYQDGFSGEYLTAAANLINAGHISRAKDVVDFMSGDSRIQGLLEISMWYLHQVGTRKSDLDSASRFIQLATRESSLSGRAGWINECMFQSVELECQKGNSLQGGRDYRRLAAAAMQNHQYAFAARAYMRMGDLLLPTDTDKERFYDSSFTLYKVLGLKEKQAELLWKLSIIHEHGNFPLAENDLLLLLKLAVETGYKHTLFVQNRLAYVLYNKEDYLGAIAIAEAGRKNMQWSGIVDVEPAFDIRMGVSSLMLGKVDASVQWFKKAIEIGTIKNHVFWYKGMLMLADIYTEDLKQPATAYAMMDSVTRLYPPVSVWDKLSLMSAFGICCDLLGKHELANKYFMQLLDFAHANKFVDPFGSMAGDYIKIAQLYISRRNMEMARKFLQQSMVNKRNDAGTLSLIYSLYYKMDSLEGNYRSALQNHIKFKLYYDSTANIDQRQKFEELNVRHVTQKKVKDIELLNQQRIAHQTQLEQNKLTRNIMASGTVLLLIITGLLYTQYRQKKHTSVTISEKNHSLQHLLNEKEWLLKEVHHRVKNNLHTIISLLESQAAYLENDALKAIENSQHRIYAMSLIHQKLYQAENVKTIDMSIYLPEFIRYLDESFNIHYRIQFFLDIDAINLGVSQAIPVALIINEAVTNSIKYAFPNNSQGQIKIAMHRKADQVTLVVSDDGIGIDEALLNMPSETLGLKLMKGLSGDINASFDLKIDNGTKITLVFDVDSFTSNDLLADKINYKQQYV